MDAVHRIPIRRSRFDKVQRPLRPSSEQYPSAQSLSHPRFVALAIFRILRGQKGLRVYTRFPPFTVLMGTSRHVGTPLCKPPSREHTILTPPFNGGLFVSVEPPPVLYLSLIYAASLELVYWTICSLVPTTHCPLSLTAVSMG